MSKRPHREDIGTPDKVSDPCERCKILSQKLEELDADKRQVTYHSYMVTYHIMIYCVLC